MMRILLDENGKPSMARCLLAVHTLQNWAWMWILILGIRKPPESDVLNLLIGSLDVSMFMVFGAWVIGLRSFAHLFPQIAAAVQGAAGLVGRAKGTDNRYEDDES